MKALKALRSNLPFYQQGQIRTKKEWMSLLHFDDEEKFEYIKDDFQEVEDQIILTEYPTHNGRMALFIQREGEGLTKQEIDQLRAAAQPVIDLLNQSSKTK